MAKWTAAALILTVLAVGNISSGTSVISDSTDPVTPGRIVDSPDPIMHGAQDGPDNVPHRSIVRLVPPPVVVPSAPGQVVRVAPRPVIVGQLCDDAGVCWSAALPYCYDNINDCRETADATCAGLGGTTSGERLTQCTVDGAVQACCEITCNVGGTPTVATCTPN